MKQCTLLDLHLLCMIAMSIQPVISFPTPIFENSFRLIFTQNTHRFFFPGTLYASPTQAASLGGQSTYVMTTPKITAYVRDFFGCNTLAGAELEEFDDYGA